LDRKPSASWISLILLAAGLGAIHSLQPGHGKTLVSAVALQAQQPWYRPALLGLVTSLAHTSTVLGLAGLLWWTGGSKVAPLHRGLLQLTGFVIAAGGFWRIGRFLGGWNDETGEDVLHPVGTSSTELLTLGLAAGAVPCWDAVGLIVLSAALGRLASGVLLVMAFGAGMGMVLVGVGLLASRLKSAMLSLGGRSTEARLGLVGGLILAGLGLSIFLS
jgi:ABC-type nickel/cobalt efflux system permease component RcnA